jgi:uncharacterized membrane protein HdeD (DUF308 family)
MAGTTPPKQVLPPHVEGRARPAGVTGPSGYPGTTAPVEAFVNTHEAEVVDPLLQKAYPFFNLEGTMLFILGMFTILVPSIFGSATFYIFSGGLMVMAALFKLLRSFKSRELPGFMPSLASAVFTLVIGSLLTMYNEDGLINAYRAATFYFFLQAITNFIYTGQFYNYPYPAGFRLIASTAMVMFLMFTLFRFAFTDARLPGIFVGTLFMVEGAVLYAVSLGLQRMAKGLPYLHPSHFTKP